MKFGRASSIFTAAPAVVILFVCSALPLIWMIVVLVANPQVRHEFRPDSFRLALLGRTVGYNTAAALIATAMGLPAGLVLGRGRGFFSRLFWVILPAALFLPSLSYAYGWSQVVRIIRPILRPVGIYFEPNGTADVFRCIWSLASWLWAVPAVLIGSALRRMDSSVQQQALLDGALWRVTIRQLLGPIIASAAIVTILATQEFAVYEPTGISVIATEVRMVFDTGSVSTPDMPITVGGFLGAGERAPDQPARAAAAVATALPLLTITVLLALLAVWGAGRSSASEALGVNEWPRTLDAPMWATFVTLGLIALNIIVPVVALFASLRVQFHPRRIWHEFSPQLDGAMFVAALTMLVAAIVALFSAARWTRGSLAIAGASFLIGGQLLAIALIRIFNRPMLSWVYDTAIITVIAYMGRFGWLALSAGRGTWTRAWRELREIASLDGANDLRIAFSIIWPLAWPVLAAGSLLVGALSLTEVPATVLLMPQNPQVLTPTLMTWVHMVRYDAMIEASLLMMGAVLIPSLAAVLLTGLGLRVIRAANRTNLRQN